MSDAINDEHAQAIASNPITLDTKITSLTNRYYFHSVLKKTQFSTHLLAEDLENEIAEGKQATYFLFKQNIYKNQAEYKYALDYYQKLKNYCREPLSKNDVIKLHALFNFEDPENNYFELAVVFDYGENDRIDVDQIQVQQITKFLKSVCVLLLDLKTKQDLYHGNISIKNIVLFEDELKISGFKPIFVNNPEFKNWKTELFQKTSHYRLDLYMIGLIWLRFLGSKIEEIQKEHMSFEDFSKLINERYHGLAEEKKTNIVEKLLDIQENPNLNLDDAILLFDEYFIIETQRTREIHATGSSNAGSDTINKNSISEVGRGSYLNSRDSNAHENNLFNKNLSDSETENITEKDEKPMRTEDIGSVDGIVPNDSIIKDHQNHDDSSKPIVEKTPEKLNKDFSKKKLSENVNDGEVKNVPEKKNSVVQSRPSNSNSPARTSSTNKTSTPKQSILEKKNSVEEKNENDLHDNIDQIAELSAFKGSAQKEDEPLKEPKKTTLNIPKKSAIKDNPKSVKKEGKLNPKQQLDLLNQKMQLQSLPLNYFDHSRSQNLTLKKTLKSEVEKIELTDEQKDKIRKQIEQEKHKKMDEIKQNEEEKKRNLEQKMQSKQKENDALKQKIDQILEKKIQDKKDRPREEEEDQRFYKTHQKHEGIDNKWNDDSLPILNNKNKVFKSVKSTKKPDQFLTPVEREDIFTYNHELKNKNVTFKKLVWNPENYFKNSRSPSPNVTSNFCELKNNAFPKTFDKTLTSDFQNTFKVEGIQGQTKNLDKDNNLANLTVNVLNSPEIQTYDLSPEIYKFEIKKFVVLHELDLINANETRNQDVALMEQFLDDMLVNDDVEGADDYYSNNKRTLSPNTKLKYLRNMISFFDKKKNQNGVKKWLIALHKALSENPVSKSNLNLPQETAFALVELELDNDKPENAIKILKSSDFKDNAFDNARYEKNFAAASIKAGKEEELANFFMQQIHETTADSFKHLDITRLFVNISRVIEILNSTGDYKKVVKFCTKMMILLKQFKKVNETLDLKEHDYENLIECFILNTLRFAKKAKNYNLMNYLIGEAIKNEEVDYEKNLNEDERVELINLVLEFCWYLKAQVNYGSYKNNYINYLNYAKNVNKHCDLKPENLKSSLTINFNRAVYHMKEENYTKSEILFDKCLNTYYAFFKDDAGQDFYNVLYDLGKALFKKNKYNESLYFFFRIMEDQCEIQSLKFKSIKRLGVAYFMLERHSKSKDIFNDFLLQNIEDRIPKRFFYFLSSYFVSCEKLGNENFTPFFKKLSDLPVESLDQELYCYFKMFKSLQKIYEEYHNYKENKKYITVLEDAINDKKNVKGNLQKIFALVGTINNELVNKSTIKSDNNIFKVAELLHDDFLTVEENAINLSKFVNNLLFAFIHLVPLFNERANNQKHRQDLYEKTTHAFPVNVMRTELYEVVKQVTEAKRKNADNHFSQSPQQPEESEREYNRLESHVVLKNPEKDSNDLILETEFQDNVQLQKLVADFLKQIKNMLFLDVIENVLTYYLRFEKALIDLGLNYPKYNFIKQLIRYHLAKDPKAEIDRSIFVGLLDKLFANYNMCRQDLKLLLILLEAFKDINYLKLCVIYLDKYHQNYAEYVIRELFYDQFIRKSATVTKKFYEQIFQTKSYELENCYFMHFLESQNFVNIDKQFSFKLFLRNRHDLLNEPEFRDLFGTYVEPAKLNLFDLKYHIYRTIIKLHKDDSKDAKNIFAVFQKNFLDALTKIDSDRNKMFVLFYEVLILAHSTNRDDCEGRV